MITFYRDPTEEHEMIYDPSKEDAFWNNQELDDDACQNPKKREPRLSAFAKEIF